MVYVYVGFAAVESPNVPSPLRSQLYVSVSPGSGSLELAPLNETTSGGGPLVGAAEITAIGYRFAPYVIRWIAPPSKST